MLSGRRFWVELWGSGAPRIVIARGITMNSIPGYNRLPAFRAPYPRFNMDLLRGAAEYLEGVLYFMLR